MLRPQKADFTAFGTAFGWRFCETRAGSAGSGEPSGTDALPGSDRRGAVDRPGVAVVLPLLSVFPIRFLFR